MGPNIPRRARIFIGTITIAMFTGFGLTILQTDRLMGGIVLFLGFLRLLLLIRQVRGSR